MSVSFINVLSIAIVAGVVVGQSTSQGNMNMSSMNNMNFNLSSMSGILGFLQSESIDPTTLVIPNCIRNGDKCQANAGQPCCLSPVFTCQPNRSGPGNACYVIPLHAPHIPQIKQIIATFGMTTDQPVQ